MEKNQNITLLLRQWSEGDDEAGDALMPIVYEELHRRSAGLFRGEKTGHTIQPTALINEAYIRLIDAGIDYQDRAHFFALASTMMRRLLIDHAKSRSAAKRGGAQIHVTFDESVGVGPVLGNSMVNLGDALEDLRSADPRKAQLIDLHYFGGLTVAEIQQVTNLSTATIGRELRFARAWLSDALTNES